MPRILLSSLAEISSGKTTNSVVQFTVRGARRILALRVGRVFARTGEGANLDHFPVVGANGAHVLPAEVDLDVRALELPVNVGEVVLYMLLPQADLMVFWRSAHHALVPHRHTVLQARFRRKLTD